MEFWLGFALAVSGAFLAGWCQRGIYMRNKGACFDSRHKWADKNLPKESK